MAYEGSGGSHEGSGNGRMIKTLTKAILHFRIQFSAFFFSNGYNHISSISSGIFGKKSDTIWVSHNCCCSKADMEVPPGKGKPGPGQAMGLAFSLLQVKGLV